MNRKEIRQFLNEMDFIRTGGSDEELRAAELLKGRCEALGAKAWLEPFPVEMAEIETATLTVDGMPVRCEGFKNCGSGTVEAELLYLPNTDAASLAAAKGKIVMIETGVTHFLFQDLVKAGIAGFITYTGDVHYADADVDKRELRSYVRMDSKRLGVNINAKDALRIVQKGARTARIEIDQREWMGESRDVVAELPGKRDEWIVLTAHYDSTPLSRGSYDNMSGCLGLLCVLEALRGEELNYGLRFLFCGSEERGLLGSAAYVEAHAGELEKLALNINLDMIGSAAGRFIACVSAEEKLANYLAYMGAELGFPIAAKTGVYSSDSTPFADAGVPALSFARLARDAVAPIHGRYDRSDVLSHERLQADIGFIAAFTRRMACAAVCPVGREIPQKVKDELDVYLYRKRKED